MIGVETVSVGGGEPAYVAIYELESPGVISSAAWATAVDRGRWADEVRPFTRNRHHAMHEVMG